MGVVTHRPYLRRIACASLLMQSVAVLCFHGLTLCIGADGHTALAWMAADDCCPQAASAAIRADDDCDCTDAPLLQPAADKRSTGDDFAATALVAAPSWSFAAARPLSAPKAASGLPPPASLLARDSVVLQA